VAGKNSRAQAGNRWLPVHSRGLFEGVTSQQVASANLLFTSRAQASSASLLTLALHFSPGAANTFRSRLGHPLGPCDVAKILENPCRSAGISFDPRHLLRWIEPLPPEHVNPWSISSLLAARNNVASFKVYLRRLRNLRLWNLRISAPFTMPHDH
jgi:hypothetical protein